MKRTMSWKEFLGLHTVAADYKEGADGHIETMPMVSVENAEKACSMAEKELAKSLLALHGAARSELLERIVSEI